VMAEQKGEGVMGAWPRVHSLRWSLGSIDLTALRGNICGAEDRPTH
jgi:hypothetical protein